jgi:translation elongation factor P/translation initiation factor 5A
VLYREDGVVHVMDNSTFEQSAVNLSVFGEKHVFVAENSDIVVHFFNGEAITGEHNACFVATSAVRNRVPPHAE